MGARRIVVWPALASVGMALAPAACVTEHLHVTRVTVLDAAPVIAANAAGAADMELVEGGTRRVPSSQPLQVWLSSSTTTHDQACTHVPFVKAVSLCRDRAHTTSDADTSATLTLGELVADCAAPHSNCPARRLADQPIAVGTRTRVSPPAVASFIGAGMMFGAASYCFVECDAKAVGGGALALGLLLVFAPILALAR